MCNSCSEHTHTHYHHPEIVQLMPVQKDLFAVYSSDQPVKYSVMQSEKGLSLVPVLFMALIRHGEKSMVEGFFASEVIDSCEAVEGFKGYASCREEADKLY